MRSFLRFLQRNKLYSFIEFFGLIVSIAFIIVILNYSVQENTVPKGQKDVERIYAIGMQNFIGMTYGTAEHVCPDIPEIEEYTRLSWAQMDVTADGNYFNVLSMATDDNYFQFFSYSLLDGNPATALKGPGSGVVSKSFANAAFNGDAIGKSIEVQGFGEKAVITVTGIFEDFNNHVFRPADIIFSIKHPVIYSQAAVGDPLDHWGSTDTFIKLAPGSDRKAVTEKVYNGYQKIWSAWGSSLIKGASLTRMDELYFSELPNEYRHGSRKMVEILMIVAFVLLVSAVLNYLNLSIAQSGKRAREMATRRLLGSSKGAVFARYCLESLIFCAISFVIAFALAAICKPMAEGLLSVKLSFAPSAMLTAMYLGLLLLISVVSGAAQYMLVSKIKPVEVMKGEFTLRSKNMFSKVFIVIQSSICIVLLALAFTMQKQMNYLMEKPRGYNSDNMILVRSGAFHDWNNYNILLSEIKKLPFVESAGLCSGTPGGYSNGQMVTNSEGEEIILRVPRIDTACFNMFGFKISEQFEDPAPGKAYFTPQTVNLVGGVEEARSLKRMSCCGIIEEYTYGSALYNSEAAGVKEGSVIQLLPDGFQWIYGIMVKTKGDSPNAISGINGMWEKVGSSIVSNQIPLDCQYFADIIYGDLQGPRNTLKLVFIFMVLSIIISLLGLFAMCSYYTSRNAKSIAINKVYGAGVLEVAVKYSRAFLWAIIISVVIAVPASIYFMQKYLEGFSDRINTPYWLILVAIAVSLLFSLIVIAGQMLDAATENPVKSLKDNN